VDREHAIGQTESCAFSDPDYSTGCYGNQDGISALSMGIILLRLAPSGVWLRSNIHVKQKE
jgi:hypothetical protein